MSRISCKICRRLGEKLCNRAKCATVRKPYPPGARGSKRRRGTMTEYGRQLREKQKVRALYGVGERQFRRYAMSALAERGNSSERLVWELERRLDSAVFRLGLASSPSSARQLVAHGHFLVNERRVTVPSYALKPGDVIQIKELSLAKVPFQALSERLKKYTPPAWLVFERDPMRGKILRLATSEDVGIFPGTIQTILEYYSR